MYILDVIYITGNRKTVLTNLIATFYQFGIAKYCPKQDIIDVITQSNEAYGLWIISRTS